MPRLVPGPPAVGGPPDSVVILLPDHIRIAGAAHHVVDAMPDLAPLGPRRVVVVGAGLRVRQAVAPLPRGTAVFGGEDAFGADAEPQAVGVCRVRDDGVQRQTRRAPLPVVGPFGQRRDLFPGLAHVVAAQQSGRLGPGVKHAVGVVQRPDLREFLAIGHRGVGPADHRGEARIVCRPIVHLSGRELGQRPRLTAVARPPDPGTVPVPAATGPERAGLGVADHMVDRPAVAERPRGDRCAFVHQKGTLRGAQQD